MSTLYYENGSSLLHCFTFYAMIFYLILTLELLKNQKMLLIFLRIQNSSYFLIHNNDSTEREFKQ